MIYEWCWLPELFTRPPEMPWAEYDASLYQEYLLLINSEIVFRGMPVKFKRYPILEDRCESYWHLTCTDYQRNGERFPDPDRCERIKWLKQTIEHVDCKTERCPECDGLLVWETRKNKPKHLRVNILFEEARYLVVLEPRKDYYLLITAFYVGKDRALNKLINDYEAHQ